MEYPGRRCDLQPRYEIVPASFRLRLLFKSGDHIVEARAADAGSNDESTSTSLIADVRKKSPQAWRRLVDIYEPVVHRWCCCAGLSNEDARDIAQHVFQTLATHIDGFRRDRPGDSFRGWLWTIARNKVR